MAANQFDFDPVVAGCSFNGLGALIGQQVQGDGSGMALMLVAHEQELLVSLTDSLFLKGETDVGLFGFEQRIESGGDFSEVFDGGGFMRLEMFQETAGSEGGGATGEVVMAGVRKLGGELGGFFEAGEFLALFEPVLVTGGAPVVEVLGFDGFAVEVGGEDFFDVGQGVKPGQNLRGGLAIEKAMVKLVAEIIGQAGDLADGGTAMGIFEFRFLI
jgi:hypothetical protein